ncbi:glycogen synthase GlgA [Spirochaeta dissipatitropha]
MSDSISVLMTASEAHPIVKIGGLADAVGALSKHLKALGTDVRIFLPNYLECRFESVKKHDIGKIRMGSRVFEASVLETHIESVTAYLLDIPELFAREGVYGPRIDEAHEDNLIRYAAFCAAVPVLCSALKWQPDIIHGHDWQSGLIPAFLRQHGSSNAFLFTIHNIGYQGDFSIDHLKDIGLNRHQAEHCGLILYDKLNFMAGGITCGDQFSTVSRTYAREIQQQQFGFGMEKVVRKHAQRLSGITNGMDYDEWDPSHDKNIPVNYSHTDLNGKAECKRLLQRETGLEEAEGIPLIGMVTRLVSQKGIYELAHPYHAALESICQGQKVQVVILGSGERWCELELQAIQERNSNCVAVIGYDEGLAHRIAAASDLFLMPSLYEPCGLSQLYAMRYGSLPVATRTGGIADTVRDGKTGFLMKHANARSIEHEVSRAVRLYTRNPSQFRTMQIQAMQECFDWEQSAKEYLDLYTRTIAWTAKYPRDI